MAPGNAYALCDSQMGWATVLSGYVLDLREELNKELMESFCVGYFLL